METKELEQLLARAKQGDQEALAALYEKTQGYAYFIAKRYLQNDEDVKDVLQDAYIAAFGKLDTLRDSATFHAWLGKIITNRSLNYLRQKRAIPTPDDLLGELPDDEELIPSAWLEREEKRREILHIIDSLPDGQRIAIVLFYLEGLSVAEIAEQMEVAAGTVKAHLYHGRKAIKAAVLKEEERGNKLYGLVAVPLLGQLMKMEAQAATMPPQLASPIWENTLRGMGGGGASPADGTGDTGASSAKPDSFLSRLPAQAKIAAGILAVALVGGGLWLAAGNRGEDPPAVPVVQEVSQEESAPAPAPEPEPEPEPDPDFEVVFSNGTLEGMLRKGLSLSDGPIMNSDLEEITQLEIVGGEILIINGEGEYELERGIEEHRIQVAPGQFSTTTVYKGVEGCLYHEEEDDEGVPVEHGVWEGFADFEGIPNLEKLAIVYCTIEDWGDVSALLEAEGLKEFSLAGSVLPDIGPLAELANLESLDLSYTNIRDFSVVAELGALKEFSANDCEISDIGFLEGMDLEALRLNTNDISDISVLAPMTGMKVLTLAINTISDISPLSAMTELDELSLWMNEVSDLSPLAGATKLRDLELSSNLIADLSPLEGLTGLEEFGVGSNQVSDISFVANNPGLTLLNVANNQITDISAVEGLTGLEQLALSMNPITGIEPVRGLTSLTDLRFFTCPNITDISPVAGLTNLTMLQMGGCSVSDLSPLADLVLLEDLRIYSNPVSDISVVAGLPNLTHIDAYTTYITDWSPAAHVEEVLH